MSTTWPSLLVMALILAAVAGIMLRGSRLRPVGIHIVLILVPLAFSGLIYLMLGAPYRADAPLSARAAELSLKQEAARAAEDAARRRLARAAEAVRSNPDDIGALLALAEASALTGEYDIEVATLQVALARTGDASVRAMLAEAMTRKADGIVTEAAAALLAETLAEAPDNQRAAYLMGLYRSQIGELNQAVRIWQDLGRRAAGSADGKPMLELVNRRLFDLARRLGESPEHLLIAPE